MKIKNKRQVGKIQKSGTHVPRVVETLPNGEDTSVKAAASYYQTQL